jgi:hypothetical protein
MDRRKLLIFAAVFIAVAGGALYLITTPRYSNNVYHEGDLIVTDVYEITDTLFTIDGSIIVQGDGKLIVNDSEIRFNQASNNQYHIEVGEWGSEGSPEVYLDNVRLNTNGKWMYASYTGNTKLTIINCRYGGTPWHSASMNTKITLRNSDIGLTVGNNVSLKAENCNLFLEYVLKNCSGTYTMPKGAVDSLDFVFDMGKETLKVETTGCRFTAWGVTLDHDTDITYKDTEITIGMNAGTSPNEKIKHVKLSNLKAQRYDDFDVTCDTNHLHLINSKVVSWYPQVFNGLTLEVEDSDLADVQWNGSNSTVIVRDCTASIAYAKDNVTYRFVDSTIQGEVTATQNSVIYLNNTNVRGKIYEYDNGQVFIDGAPYEGQ